jgi:hypothetical protein
MNWCRFEPGIEPTDIVPGVTAFGIFWCADWKDCCMFHQKHKRGANRNEKQKNISLIYRFYHCNGNHNILSASSRARFIYYCPRSIIAGISPYADSPVEGLAQAYGDIPLEYCDIYYSLAGHVLRFGSSKIEFIGLGLSKLLILFLLQQMINSKEGMLC